MLTSNETGARASSSITLYRYDTSSTSSLPNAATITVPACTATEGFTATVDLSDIQYSEVYIVFVTDRSANMDNDLSGVGADTMIAETKAGIKATVSSLFDALPRKTNVGLVGYADGAGTGLCSNTSLASCTTDDDCSSGTCKNILGFQTSESNILSRIKKYRADGYRYTDLGLSSAKTLLDDGVADGSVPAEARKIVVLLSSGSPASSTETETVAQDIKDAGYELFTLALASSSMFVNDMAELSSNTDGYEYNTDNNIDYAYDGNSAKELAAMYQAIADVVTGATLTLVSTDSSGTYLSSATVTSAASQSLPWPEGFTCDEADDQTLPVRINFFGEGQVTLSDVQMNYCAP